MAKRAPRITPWWDTSFTGESGATGPDAVAGAPGVVPAQVTDAWDTLRAALGQSAPANLAAGKFMRQAFSNLVK